jgi:hypothetical protein
MRRILGSLIVCATLLVASSASANQCPKLIAQIYAAAGSRFDATASAARQKANEAATLHAAGKHEEAEAAAKEGLKVIGTAQK